MKRKEFVAFTASIMHDVERELGKEKASLIFVRAMEAIARKGG